LPMHSGKPGHGDESDQTWAESSAAIRDAAIDLSYRRGFHLGLSYQPTNVLVDKR
jgi:hypothetical protein